MKNLADLKRALELGATVETITVCNGIAVPDTHPFRIRQVVKVQGKAVKLGDSWLDFELAGNWSFDGDVFANRDGRTYRLVTA
jgi:hypothetical protein